MSSTEHVLTDQCPATGRQVQIKIVYQVDYGKMCPVSLQPVAVECLEGDACKARNSGEDCLVYDNTRITGLLATNSSDESK